MAKAQITLSEMVDKGRLMEYEVELNLPRQSSQITRRLQAERFGKHYVLVQDNRPFDVCHRVQDANKNLYRKAREEADYLKGSFEVKTRLRVRRAR